MKQLLFAGVLILSGTYSCPVAAQTATDYDLAKESPKKASKEILSTTTHSNPFLETEMAFTKGSISFSNLPELPKNTWAIITNTEGEFIKETRINAQYNAIDLHRLPRGLYFVTLVYRNKSMKAYTLNVVE